MGLALRQPIYADKIKENLIEIKNDGTFKLDISYFKFHRGFRMTSKKFHKLFGSLPRSKESDLKQFHMDLAASIQMVTEEMVLKLADTLVKETGIKNICLAGGVALNCVANGKLLKTNKYNIWIQPASGDAGSSLGAALLAHHQYYKRDRIANPEDSMKGTYLGCEFDNVQIIRYLKEINAYFHSVEDKNYLKRLLNILMMVKLAGLMAQWSLDQEH